MESEVGVQLALKVGQFGANWFGEYAKLEEEKIKLTVKNSIGQFPKTRP